MRIVPFKACHISDVVSLWNSVVEVEQGIWGKKFSDDRLSGIVSSEAFLADASFIATDHNQLVGFAFGCPTEDDREGGLAGLAVSPAHWRRGIGRALLESIERAMKRLGKTAVVFEPYGLSFSLLHCIYIDSNPYRFLLWHDYKPLGHGMLLRNDLSKFQLSEDIKRRQSQLEVQGFTFQWYEHKEHRNLLQFMERYFPGDWATSIESAIDKNPPAKVLLAKKEDQIIGFIGPFLVGEKGQPGWFGSPGVRPDFGGQGVGTVLVHLGLDYLRRAGCSYTQYDTDVDNPARLIYFKTGAQLVHIACYQFYKEL